MAEAAPLAFNVSVPSDGLQGRSRLEKLMHKWLDGSDEAGRRLKYVLWGPGGMGKSTLALKFDEGRESEAVGGCGWCSGYRLRAWSRTADIGSEHGTGLPRGCSTRCWARAPGGRRRTPLKRCLDGFTSCCSLRRGAGRGWRSSMTCPRRPTTSWRGRMGGPSSRRGRPSGCSRGRTLGK
jgi:hypothetical protein